MYTSVAITIRQMMHQSIKCVVFNFCDTYTSVAITVRQVMYQSFKRVVFNCCDTYTSVAITMRQMEKIKTVMLSYLFILNNTC